MNRIECLVFAGLNCQAENICCSFGKRTEVIQWRILLERLSLLNRRKNKAETENPQMHECLPNLLGCHNLVSQNTWLAEPFRKVQSISLLTMY